MTRKDYQLIASHVDLAVRRGDINREGVGFIAEALEYDNSRFNRDKFFAACGVEHRS